MWSCNHAYHQSYIYNLSYDDFFNNCNIRWCRLIEFWSFVPSRKISKSCDPVWLRFYRLLVFVGFVQSSSSMEDLSLSIREIVSLSIKLGSIILTWPRQTEVKIGIQIFLNGGSKQPSINKYSIITKDSWKQNAEQDILSKACIQYKRQKTVANMHAIPYYTKYFTKNTAYRHIYSVFMTMMVILIN
jgi:hypothetical protein